MLEIEPALTIVGDIHGQLDALVRYFDAVGYPPKVQFLFLGDYLGEVLFRPIVILQVLTRTEAVRAKCAPSHNGWHGNSNRSVADLTPLCVK
ncbi:hypothetical protein CRE_04982 [Caenorhabditis remanei]|uniref:Calcineurin-like phosphoesterase domain-containing protein n=1 Tax=Caenorhabditis remanei TaxID=31234 RepID=E3MNB0_CAERE|nr:hypothetical protein CRE_04982 [Caenorhabditis remanei]